MVSIENALRLVISIKRVSDCVHLKGGRRSLQLGI